MEPALRRIRPAGVRRWTPGRIAAAWVAMAVLSATAAVLVHNDFFIDSNRPAGQTAETIPAETIVRAIDFEATPLPVVVEKIKNVYGVDVTGLTDDADDYILSLHYEGSATDLLETINDILETDISIKK